MNKNNMLRKFLSRIPIWIRAVLGGLIVVEVISKIWSLVAGSNISISPAIPWSFPVMAVLLWLFWSYLGGSGPPESTSLARKNWLRAGPLRHDTRFWSLIAAALLGASLILLIVIATRLTDFEPGQIGQIERVSAFPSITVVCLIVMTSLVAAVAEEAGFRGYMQRPLENAYGPAAGIGATALVFTLIHLPNAAIAPHTIPIFFFGSLGWGLLAYLTGSIRPGIIIHFLIDLIAYLWVWLNLNAAKTLAKQSIVTEGVDGTFVIQIVFFIFSVLALSVVYIRLGRIANTRLNDEPKAEL